MSIKHWPNADKPREKLLALGEQNLTDAELLAICLRTGLPGQNALELAKNLLIRYGSLKQLVSASSQDLIQTKGIGIAKYILLRAAVELGRRYLKIELPKKFILKDGSATYNFLKTKLAEYNNEVFVCLFLDVKLRIIHYEEMFKGTLSEVNVYPREIVRLALKYHAASVILAHNHPSGDINPSFADKELTALIKKALNLMDIAVLDHIIVGFNSYFSFNQHGLI